MPRVSVTLDCNDPERLADFWCAALGYERYFADGPFLGLRPAGEGDEFCLEQVT